LDVVTKGEENAAPWTYRAPITENRSSKQTDEVKRFPLSRIKEIAAAGGSFAQAMRLMQEENPNQDPKITAQQLSENIKASLAAAAARLKPSERFKVVKGKLVDITTGEEMALREGISPESALKAIRGVYDKYATSLGAENVDTNQVLAEANELIAGAQGGQAGPKPGDIVDGYEFQGGNPADKSNWKEITTGPSS
jgi:hypothetical protein